MSLVTIPWQPTTRQLRQFGAASLVALPLLAGSLAPPSLRFVGLGIGVALALVIALIAMLRPHWLRPLFVGLCVIAYPLGVIVGEILLVVVYFGAFTPLAFLGRLL